LTNDALLPLEKFVVGGHDTVRGYRENQLVRDNGFTASAELRIPFYQRDGAEAQWQIAPFVDYGNAWEEEADTPDPRDITSVGVELRWQPTRRLHASVSAAHAFENIDRADRDRDLQDRGIQFLLSYQLF
jgi:hemolysin activation/secretion protein